TLGKLLSDLITKDNKIHCLLPNFELSVAPYDHLPSIDQTRSRPATDHSPLTTDHRPLITDHWPPAIQLRFLLRVEHLLPQKRSRRVQSRFAKRWLSLIQFRDRGSKSTAERAS